MSLWYEDEDWHFDYVRLAFDKGFSFGKHKQKIFDKSRISLINIDNVIKERDVELIEKCIPSIIQFSLDSENTELLESSFIKTFKISQLCIEYLLFCKKYLDSNVGRLKEECQKLKDEKQELERFCEELKRHINTLIHESLSTFQCDECNKMFSSEEYLNAHIKRRHNSVATQPKAITAPDKDVDIEQLQLEIKELKSRLKKAEAEIEEQNALKKIEQNDSKLSNLETKFENLKVEIENELKSIQKQNNVEEKYEKWFEMTLKNVEELRNNMKQNMDSNCKHEIMTQTEEVSNDEVDSKQQKNDEKLAEIEEHIESKVKSNFQKIESQMKLLLERVDKIEENKKQQLTVALSPPEVKPRTKLKSAGNIVDKISKEYSINLVEKDVLVEQKQQQNNVDDVGGTRKRPRWAKREVGSPINLKVADNLGYEDDEVSSTNSDFENDNDKSVVDVPNLELDFEETYSVDQVKPMKEESKITTETTSVEISENFLKDFEEQVGEIVNNRLQSLGISPEWTGIPWQTYEHVKSILDHQTGLIKKAYPNFDEIEEELDKKVLEMINPSKNVKKESPIISKFVKEKKPKRRPSPQLVKPSPSKLTPASQIEIKNRKLFETDSEPDVEIQKVVPKYSAVIEEFRKRTALKEITTLQNSQSLDVLTEKGRNDEARGVLKNYPSNTSLIKKRVNFDLKEDEQIVNKNKDTFKDGGGGSTTSVPSSVLDEQFPVVKKKQAEEVEDLSSDFDLSDL